MIEKLYLNSGQLNTSDVPGAIAKPFVRERKNRPEDFISDVLRAENGSEEKPLVERKYRNPMFSDYNYGGMPQDAIDQLKLAYSNQYSGVSSLPRNYARYKKAPYNGPFQISTYQLKSDPNFVSMNYQPNGQNMPQNYQSQSQYQTPNMYAQQPSQNKFYQYQTPQPQGQNNYQQNDYQNDYQTAENAYAQEMERHMQEKKRREVKERKAPSSEAMPEKSDKSFQNSNSNKFQQQSGSRNMQQSKPQKQQIDLNSPEYEEAMNKFFGINEQEKYMPKYKAAAETYKVYNILSHNRQVEYNPKFEFFVKNENPNEVNQELLKRKEKNKAFETKERNIASDKNYGDEW